MQLGSAFLLLCLPGCLTLGTPKVLEGTVGSTLMITCRYKVGEEGPRKFWCRGANWMDCVRVIETAQPAKEEARRGRVTLQDRPWGHHFIVSMTSLETGDADTYWCGVDSPKHVPQAPVMVAVLPGPTTTATRTLETMGSSMPASPMSNPGHPTWLLWMYISCMFLVSLKVTFLLSLGCIITWLAWTSAFP
ncbi:CMRF35-like molecule 6 [Ochotona curzoniae]|uniref:CMRF35-like molecule 6 n=1 Tax=Ochotona curzoniae TaxID=130825 RepID=UPI001B346D66|nr:CMRF35-like molecule 6 [Ochotona curzoniae]